MHKLPPCRTTILPLTLLLMVLLIMTLTGCPNPAGSDGGGSGEDGSGDAAGTEDPGGEQDQPQGRGPEIRVSLDGSALADGDTVDFGQITQSEGGASRTITIENTGDESLSFSSIEIGGPNGENTTDPANESGTFHWTAAPETAALAAGESRDLEIEISYSSVAGTVSGTLTIESDTEGDGVSPLVMNLQAEFFEEPVGMDPWV